MSCDFTLDEIHRPAREDAGVPEATNPPGVPTAAQDERRIERQRRGESGEWRQEEAVGEGFVPYPRPETKLPLNEIYEGL